MSDLATDATQRIQNSFEEHLAAVAACRAALQPVILDVAAALRRALAAGNTLLLCGNGGSAADSQHIAAELIGRFGRERGALRAISLSTDTSILTSLGNDYGFDDVFARQVEGLARPGDVFIGISTSGRSRNVLRAAQAARRAGCTVVGLLGRNGGEIAALCDHPIIIPARATPRIQEMHILIGHMLCDLVDDLV